MSLLKAARPQRDYLLWLTFLLVLAVAAGHYSRLGEEYSGLSVSFFFAPVGYGALRGGLRVGLGLALLALLLILPHIILAHGPVESLTEMGELGVLVLAGALIGWEVDRRRHTLALLQASEAQHRELFERASDAILLLDAQDRITAVNEAATLLSGYRAEELIGKGLASILDLEGPGRGDKPLEAWLRKKDGEERLLEVSAALSRPKGTTQMVIRDITLQKQAHENLQRYAAAVTNAQEEERKRIARDLHDDTAQALVSLARRFDQLLSRHQRLPQEVRGQLEEMWQLTEQTLEGVRRFSQDLRPSIIDDLGLLSAIEWLAKRLSAEQSINARVEVVGEPCRPPPQTELTLFRIVQEALRNIAKHARASEARVRVEFSPGKISIAISDDGQGFAHPARLGEAAVKGHLGLLGMQERAQLLGGRLQIRSQPGQGTTVLVEAPSEEGQPGPSGPGPGCPRAKAEPRNTTLLIHTKRCSVFGLGQPCLGLIRLAVS